MAGWWREREGGIEIHVRLTPRANRDVIEGVETDADEKVYLKVRVRAVPEDGKANEALLKLTAKAAGAAKSDAKLISGATSRMKRLYITGDAAALVAQLEAALAG